MEKNTRKRILAIEDLPKDLPEELKKELSVYSKRRKSMVYSLLEIISANNGINVDEMILEIFNRSKKIIKRNAITATLFYLSSRKNKICKIGDDWFLKK